MFRNLLSSAGRVQLVGIQALAEDADRQIVSAYAAMRSGGPIPFAALSEQLFRWAGGIITAGGAGK